jgi:hypothetical protein
MSLCTLVPSPHGYATRVAKTTVHEPTMLPPHAATGQVLPPDGEPPHARHVATPASTNAFPRIAPRL